jgi:hypothetical protein
MKKRALSLLEIMIVIFLITLITGAVGYSMRGTLDKGRAFRTDQAKEQLHDLLMICLAEKADAEAIANDPVFYLKQLGLAKDPDNLIVDGWKVKFEIKPNKGKTDFNIKSEALEKYKAKQNRAKKNTTDAIEPDEDD